MDYADGTPARIGDIVKGPHPNSADHGPKKMIVGTVVDAFPANETCNLRVLPLACVTVYDNARMVHPGETSAVVCTASDFVKVQ